MKCYYSQCLNMMPFLVYIENIMQVILKLVHAFSYEYEYKKEYLHL